MEIKIFSIFVLQKIIYEQFLHMQNSIQKLKNNSKIMYLCYLRVLK